MGFPQAITSKPQRIDPTARRETIPVFLFSHANKTSGFAGRKPVLECSAKMGFYIGGINSAVIARISVRFVGNFYREIELRERYARSPSGRDDFTVVKILQ